MTSVTADLDWSRLDRIEIIQQVHWNCHLAPIFKCVSRYKEIKHHQHTFTLSRRHTLMSKIERKYCLISTSYLTGLFGIFIERTVCVLVTFHQWGYFVILIIRNLNLISFRFGHISRHIGYTNNSRHLAQKCPWTLSVPRSGQFSESVARGKLWATRNR